jgi:exonuclease III
MGSPRYADNTSGFKRRRARGKRSIQAMAERKAKYSLRRRLGRQLHRSRNCFAPINSTHVAGETTTEQCVGENIKCLQLNLNGLLSKKSELAALVDEHKPHIVAACELKLDSTVSMSESEITNYQQAVRKDRPNQSGGGVALWVKNDIDYYVPFQDNSVHEICWIVIHTLVGDILVASCYLPPTSSNYRNSRITGSSTNHDSFFQYMTEKISLLAPTVSGTLLLGDFNSADSASFAKMNLFLQTVSMRCHVKTPTRGEKILDQLISDFSDDRIKCKTLAPISDHKPVLSTVDAKVFIKPPVLRNVYCFHRARWKKMNQYFRSMNLKQICGGNDASAATSRLTAEIKKAIALYVPRKKLFTSSTTLPWWNSECCAAFSKKQRASVDELQFCQLRLQNAINKARTRYQNEIRNKLKKGVLKQHDWWSTVAKCTGFSKVSRGIPSLLVNDNGSVDVIHDNTKKADVFAEMISSKSPPQADSDAFNFSFRNPNSLEFLPIRVNIVKKLLRSVDDRTATGPDAIPAKVLKKNSDTLSLPISLIIRKSMSKSSWPSSWKLANVVMLHKRNSKSEAKNYRGVFLLPAMSKIGEKIISFHISNFFEKYKIIPSQQFAYKKGTGGADLGALLAGNWLRARNQRKKIGVYNADVVSAFDRVLTVFLMSLLESVGIRGQLLAWMADYFTGRFFKVVVGGGHSSIYSILNTICQGSILGPLWWSVFFREAGQAASALGFLYAIFADDLVCFKYYDNDVDDDVILEDLRKCQQATHDWGKRQGILFDPNKESFCIIGGSKSIDPFKFIGITFDSELKMDKHCDIVAAKFAARTKSLLRSSATIGRLPTMIAYKAYCRPLAEYSICSFSHANKTNLSKIDAVQRHFIRAAGVGYIQSLHVRRNVSELGLIRRAALKETPDLICDLLPAASPPAHRYRTRNISNAHNMQIQLVQANSDTTAYRRSFLVRAVKQFNNLAADIVAVECSDQKTDRSSFSRKMTKLLEESETK